MIGRGPFQCQSNEDCAVVTHGAPCACTATAKVLSAELEPVAAEIAAQARQLDPPQDIWAIPCDLDWDFVSSCDGSLWTSATCREGSCHPVAAGCGF